MYNSVRIARPPNTPGKRRALYRLANMGVGHRKVMGPVRQLNNISNFLSRLERLPGGNYRNGRKIYRFNKKNGTLVSKSSIGRAPIRGVYSPRGSGGRLALKM